MKFSVGDIVLLKRTGEEGRVVEWINEEMLEVEVGQTHFPVFVDEVEHPYLKWFTEKKKVAVKRKSTPEMIPPEDPGQAVHKNIEKGFHFCFLPVYRFDAFEDVVHKLKVYFINQMSFEVTLQYECSLPSGSIFSHTAQVGPFGHFYLHDVAFEHMHYQPRFCWILTRRYEGKRESRMSETLRLKPKKLFEYITKAQVDNSPSFHIKVADDFPEADFVTDAPPVIDTELLKQKVTCSEIPRTRSKAHTRSRKINEIDLHIEQLVASTAGLSNFEMLQIQLDAFEQALYAAIDQQQLSLVVIHGVGKGRLKEEIHAMLRSIPEVSFYQHEWSPRYGYGATEVFLMGRGCLVVSHNGATKGNGRKDFYGTIYSVRIIIVRSYKLHTADFGIIGRGEMDVFLRMFATKFFSLYPQ